MNFTIVGPRLIVVTANLLALQVLADESAMRTMNRAPTLVKFMVEVRVCA